MNKGGTANIRPLLTLSVKGFFYAHCACKEDAASPPRTARKNCKQFLMLVVLLSVVINVRRSDG